MPARSRRPAREAALRALYEAELGKTPAMAALESSDLFQEMPEELKAVASRMVEGVVRELAKLNKAISAKLQDWDLSRVAVVDRTLLRIGAYELFHEDAVPPKVTLNEAIELAKKYSTAESGKFVNGVLAAIYEDSPKKNWVPTAEEVEEPAEPEPEPELEAINEDAPEAQELAKVGKWKLRAEDPQS